MRLLECCFHATGGLDNVARIVYNGFILIKGVIMSKLTEYTIEVYKCDRRVKGSYRLIEKKDFAPVTEAYINTVAEKFMNDGFIVKIFETYVTKTNLMGGKEFTERYDTPIYCSPSSESYWSM
jgi:hypothetical protein